MSVPHTSDPFDKENLSRMASKELESPATTPPMVHAEHAPGEFRHTSAPGHPAYAEHGALIDPEEKDIVEAQPDLWWSRIRDRYRFYFAEFLGTFILIMFGDGVVAQVVLSNGEKGDYQSISWGWG